MCGNGREDLQRFILHWPAYREERRRRPGMQRPYEEDEDQVTRRILFENENTNIENTKETITKFWQKEKRQELTKTQTQTQITDEQQTAYIECLYELN